MITHSKSKQLFKRDVSGNVRVWSAETGTDGENWGWRTLSGLKDGKIVASEWRLVEQKNVGRVNETSLQEQAEFEMNAELSKKKDRGYFEDIKSIDSFEKFKPMLAAKYEDHKFDFASREYYSQPKLDGIRCIARRDGLWTRAGKEIVSCPHIHDELSVFFDKYPEAVLDGELYNHDLKEDFNKITSLVRKTKPTDKDIEECSELVEYHVYDVGVMPSNENVSFIQRWDWIYSLGYDKKVKVVKTKKIVSEDEMNELYGDYLFEGYEGQMIRLDTPYENKRSKNLLKRKEFITDEFSVVSVEEGQGNWRGHIKRFILLLPDGREFGAGVRGKQEVLKKLFESEEKPNWATLRYFTPTPDGVPRFPVVIDWGIGKRED